MKERVRQFLTAVRSWILRIFFASFVGLAYINLLVSIVKPTSLIDSTAKYALLINNVNPIIVENVVERDGILCYNIAGTNNNECGKFYQYVLLKMPSNE